MSDPELSTHCVQGLGHKICAACPVKYQVTVLSVLDAILTLATLLPFLLSKLTSCRQTGRSATLPCSLLAFANSKNKLPMVLSPLQAQMPGST